MTWETTFNEAQATATTKKEFKPIPAGEYTVEITAAKINEANQYGPRVELEYVIEQPQEFYGRKLWSNYNLNSTGISFLKRDLLVLGHDVQKAEQLPTALENITGYTAKVHVRYKPGKTKTGEEKEYQNIFINDLVDKGLPF